MATIDDVISDALMGIEVARPAVKILESEVPAAAAIIEPALTAFYEGLVAIQAARAHENPEEEMARARDRITEAVQNLAALKFGAQP